MPTSETISAPAPAIDSERIIHSIKTALACLIGLLLAKLVHFAVDQWLIITIAVVMCGQANVGSMLTKSKMRFLGTLSGSLIAGFTIAFLGTSTIAITSVIAISSMIFSYIATSEKSYNESGTLGAVTVIVIMLGQNPSLYTATHRFLEISAGILIAALVSQFILPIRARDHLRRMQAKTIAQLCEYYQFTLLANREEASIHELDEDIVKSLSSQRSLAKQASREPFGIIFDPEIFTKLLRCEKEIFRSIVCMHYACKMLPDEKSIQNNMPVIQQFHHLVLTSFDLILKNIERKKMDKLPITIPSTQPMKDAVNAIRANTEADDLVYMDGFLFCAELLVVQLTELVILIGRKFSEDETTEPRPSGSAR
jgi:uncharacterized membrane protein YgaE (UPF0421/DUF939 family)